MIETVFAVGVVSFVLGWLAGRRSGPARPMRLVKVNAFTAPGLAPLSWTETEMWRAHVTSFAWHGSLIGFSYRQMRTAGVCRRRAWKRYTDLLKGAGILQAAEGSETTWAGGWSAIKLRVALEHKLISLPYPPGKPPEINSVKLVAAQLARRGAAGAPNAAGRL
jgi:hypothetical protein